MNELSKAANERLDRYAIQVVQMLSRARLPDGNRFTLFQEAVRRLGAERAQECILGLIRKGYVKPVVEEDGTFAGVNVLQLDGTWVMLILKELQ